MDVTTYQRKMAEFKLANATLIASLCETLKPKEMSQAISEFHFELSDDLKGVLGSEGANASSDDDGDQENAIAAAEEWVTDNVSNDGDLEDTVALALWLKGMDEGQKSLMEILGTPQADRSLAELQESQATVERPSA